MSTFLDRHRKAEGSFYFAPGLRYYPHFAEAMASGPRDAIYQLRRNYVRRNMSGECFTLMRNMGDGGHNVPVIKDRWGVRKLTPRECARLQGYDDFILPPELSRSQLGKQIGNSVTVPLVKRLADECATAIRGLSAGWRKPAVRWAS